jgi:DNA-directed RNA polymerase specialized sigma24 family protein
MKLAFQAPSPAMDPVASGDAEALVAAAYLEHRDELCRYLGRLVRDEVWAADLTQSAFERLLRAARAGQPPTNTRAWLVRVATNEFLSGYRHRKVAAAARHPSAVPGRGRRPGDERRRERVCRGAPRAHRGAPARPGARTPDARRRLQRQAGRGRSRALGPRDPRAHPSRPTSGACAAVGGGGTHGLSVERGNVVQIRRYRPRSGPEAPGVRSLRPSSALASAAGAIPAGRRGAPSRAAPSQHQVPVLRSDNTSVGGGACAG